MKSNKGFPKLSEVLNYLLTVCGVKQQFYQSFEGKAEAAARQEWHRLLFGKISDSDREFELLNQATEKISSSFPGLGNFQMEVTGILKGYYYQIYPKCANATCPREVALYFAINRYFLPAIARAIRSNLSAKILSPTGREVGDKYTTIFGDHWYLPKFKEEETTLPIHNVLTVYEKFRSIAATFTEKDKTSTYKGIKEKPQEDKLRQNEFDLYRFRMGKRSPTDKSLDTIVKSIYLLNEKLKKTDYYRWLACTDDKKNKDIIQAHLGQWGQDLSDPELGWAWEEREIAMVVLGDDRFSDNDSWQSLRADFDILEILEIMNGNKESLKHPLIIKLFADERYQKYAEPYRRRYKEQNTPEKRLSTHREFWNEMMKSNTTLNENDLRAALWYTRFTTRLWMDAVKLFGEKYARHLTNSYLAEYYRQYPWKSNEDGTLNLFSVCPYSIDTNEVNERMKSDLDLLDQSVRAGTN